MEFEWDEEKNRVNITKHGIDFELALVVFDDPDLLTRVDDRFDYGEAREVSIGQMPLVTQGQVIMVLVVHTERNGITRIISVRKATKQERRLYEEAKFFS
ncbi:MAG: BrnT family toxin [Stigonema ocellatum SAG 48.90 = DSM 106950]|nr:BrnT family toxin [Stigonema ocellatum SAG 48.90 = DSM 106950]